MPSKTHPYFPCILNLELGFFRCFAPLKNPSLVVSDFASIEFVFFDFYRLSKHKETIFSAARFQLAEPRSWQSFVVTITITVTVTVTTNHEFNNKSSNSKPFHYKIFLNLKCFSIRIAQPQHCSALALLRLSIAGIAQHQHCLALALALLSISIAQHQRCLTLALALHSFSISTCIAQHWHC